MKDSIFCSRDELEKSLSEELCRAIAYSTVKAVQLPVANKTNGLTCLIYYPQFIHRLMGREGPVWAEVGGDGRHLKLKKFLRLSFF